jgi:hypothetical protein
MATEIFLKLATGKTVRVACDTSEKVGVVKAKIEAQEGIVVAAQRLIFAGKVRPASRLRPCFAQSIPPTGAPLARMIFSDRLLVVWGSRRS